MCILIKADLISLFLLEVWGQALARTRAVCRLSIGCGCKWTGQGLEGCGLLTTGLVLLHVWIQILTPLWVVLWSWASVQLSRLCTG